MSYEQKYLKYKQKYQELKKMVGGGAHKLETEDYNEMPDFTLTDTPTFHEQSKSLGYQRGGADEMDMEVEKDYTLSDTPNEELENNNFQSGGAPLITHTYTPGVPLASCPGQANPMPNVQVPIPGNAAPNPVPTGGLPMVGGNDIEAEELNTTTDLSEIQNTEDIAKLFGQFGGKHRDSSSSSSSSSGSDSDFSDSDSF
jgi:hypothetical protein